MNEASSSDRPGSPRNTGLSGRLRRRRWPLALAGLVVVGVLAWMILVLTSGGTRVLSLGDSLTAQSDTQIMDDLGGRGYDVRVNALSGSGLLDAKVDWNAIARVQVQDFNPRVAVVEFIGNYGPYGTRPGIVDGSPAFYLAWAAAAQQLENTLASRGAKVYWVIGPPVQSAKLQQKVSRIDQIYAKLRPPGSTKTVPLINMYKAFGGPGGTFREFLPGPNGKPVQVRAPDGTHLAPAGVALFSKTIADAVSSGRIPLP